MLMERVRGTRPGEATPRPATGSGTHSLKLRSPMVPVFKPPKRDTNSHKVEPSPRLRVCERTPAHAPEPLVAPSPVLDPEVLTALALSETVYKELDEGGQARAVAEWPLLQQSFRRDLGLRRVQWSLPHVQQRYMLGETDEALYVVFMGTKQRRDILANADVAKIGFLLDHPLLLDRPAAHRGFWERAQSVEVEALHQQAVSQGKRLILCGHSLGAAVAQLCALQLLLATRGAALGSLAAVGFAAPAVGNPALAAYVAVRGWGRAFANYVLPEDTIGRFINGYPTAYEGMDGLSPRLTPAGDPQPRPPAAQQASNITPFSRRGTAAAAQGGPPLAVLDKRGHIRACYRLTAASEARQGSLAAPRTPATAVVLPPLPAPRQLGARESLAGVPQGGPQGVLQPLRRALLSSWGSVVDWVVAPLYFARTFAPVGQQIQLPKPGGPSSPLARSPRLGPGGSAALADAEGLPGTPGGGLVDDAAASAAARSEKQRATMLLMHRLPTYRARAGAILSGDATSSATDWYWQQQQQQQQGRGGVSGGGGNPLGDPLGAGHWGSAPRLSTSLAPRPRVRSMEAVLVPSLEGLQEALRQRLGAAGLLAERFQGAVREAACRCLAHPPASALDWVRAPRQALGWALRQALRRTRAALAARAPGGDPYGGVLGRAPRHVLLSVWGRELGLCREAALLTSGGARLPLQSIQRRRGPIAFGLRPSAQAATTLLVTACVPASTPLHGLRLQLRSDFYEVAVPVDIPGGEPSGAPAVAGGAASPRKAAPLARRVLALAPFWLQHWRSSGSSRRIGLPLREGVAQKR